jgi:hypothetical protein
MGRMLDTLQPLGVLTSTWFIKNLVCCGGWPAAPAECASPHRPSQAFAQASVPPRGNTEKKGLKIP